MSLFISLNHLCNSISSNLCLTMLTVPTSVRCAFSQRFKVRCYPPPNPPPPSSSRGTVYRETVSQKVIVFRVLCYPLSPVVLCTVRLCLRKLSFLGCCVTPLSPVVLCTVSLCLRKLLFLGCCVTLYLPWYCVP